MSIPSSIVGVQTMAFRESLRLRKRLSISLRWVPVICPLCSAASTRTLASRGRVYSWKK